MGHFSCPVKARRDSWEAVSFSFHLKQRGFVNLFNRIAREAIAKNERVSGKTAFMCLCTEGFK